MFGSSPSEGRRHGQETGQETQPNATAAIVPGAAEQFCARGAHGGQKAAAERGTQRTSAKGARRRGRREDRALAVLAGITDSEVSYSARVARGKIRQQRRGKAIHLSPLGRGGWHREQTVPATPRRRPYAP